MSWNYRVMKKIDLEGNIEYGVYEVFYNEDGVPISNTTKSVIPLCDSFEDLKYEFDLISMAFEEEELTFMK